MPEEDFVGAAVAVCAIADAPDAALAATERFWLLLGAMPVTLAAEEHDRRVSLTEWLPYLGAAALARLGARAVARGAPEELLVSPAFLDATSILTEEAEGVVAAAASNADLAAPQARALAQEILEIADLLDSGPATLAEWMAPARAFRRRFPDS